MNMPFSTIHLYIISAERYAAFHQQHYLLGKYHRSLSRITQNVSGHVLSMLELPLRGGCRSYIALSRALFSARKRRTNNQEKSILVDKIDKYRQQLLILKLPQQFPSILLRDLLLFYATRQPTCVPLKCF